MISDYPFAPKLTEIFRDVLNNPKIVLEDSLTAEDVEGWDSLNHIDLMYAIEKAFKIRFSLAEVGKLQNVGELADLIAKKLG